MFCLTNVIAVADLFMQQHGFFFNIYRNFLLLVMLWPHAMLETAPVRYIFLLQGGSLVDKVPQLQSLMRFTHEAGLGRL